MLDQPMTFEQAIERAQQSDFADRVAAAHRQRREVLERFPLERWPDLPLREYALGQADVPNEEVYCWQLEFNARELGSIAGGSSSKHIIYWSQKRDSWDYPALFSDVEEAWRALRSAFVEAFECASKSDWSAIDEIELLQSGSALLSKSLTLYFPGEKLPIHSKSHLRAFLTRLGRGDDFRGSDGVIRLNRLLLETLREYEALQDWTPLELEKLLYEWMNPSESPQVVKIAPGSEAELWSECRDQGYIRVGWDEVGDLKQYDSWSDFKEAFADVYHGTYNGHQSTLTKKARELWTLRKLNEGDLIVANRGKSQVLAIGEVIDPVYEYRSELDKCRHFVHVDWDESYATDVPTQERWGMVTVAKVEPEIFDGILERKGGAKPRMITAGSPLFSPIEEALEQKGQAILYGPPGTGKTYHARRFAKWWLQKYGAADVGDVAQGDDLAAKQGARNYWMLVANPSEWSFEKLFNRGEWDYDYRRIKRNYALVREGDVFFGYQSHPDKRIVATGRISRPLSKVDGSDEKTIGIEPLARVVKGLTWEELKEDPVLGESEPLRHRCQGTLFKLTQDEADRMIELLSERQPELADVLSEQEDDVSPLTQVTFHPSYSYEDFIEGFRPMETGDGTLNLALTDGVFKRICRQAKADPRGRYLILVDEINRANLSKVFGELITLLEYDKRGMIVTLPQSKEPFEIPPNVYLLATMNTVDRSLRHMDAAIRRRFRFIEVMPDLEVLRGARVGGLALDDFLEELNRRIADREGREKQIGHSYLMADGTAVTDVEQFATLFRYEIVPLLAEYCYDDFDALASYLGNVVDVQGQSLREEVLDKPSELVEHLIREFGRAPVEAK